MSFFDAVCLLRQHDPNPIDAYKLVEPCDILDAGIRQELPVQSEVWEEGLVIEITIIATIHDSL